MKTIVTVNTKLPTVEDAISYNSDQSLADFDIILFAPRFPYLGRIEFSAGGSCISIESGRVLISSLEHWKHEINGALDSGKTVFFLLDSLQKDAVAIGSSSPRKDQQLYQTKPVTNFDVLPVQLSTRNAKGSRCRVVDDRFHALFMAIEGSLEYRVLINTKLTKNSFLTRDGKDVLGGVAQVKGQSGHLVLIPYFDVPEGTVDNRGKEWTSEALQSSQRIVSQLLEIDRLLLSAAEQTAAPDWVAYAQKPKQVEVLDEAISAIDAQVSALLEAKQSKVSQKDELLRFTALLYESGAPLEDAISESLKLLGYDVKNFRDGDLEIDHIIVGPSGVRLIGEAEGKDNSAITIKKFRQLETNIQEDFAREEVTEPAKGILFGNGFRLVEPSQREEQFTEKCVKNADRLGTALVRTADLYNVVLHILNNPEDESFKQFCREAIENTVGKVVEFPAPSELRTDQ